MCSAKNQYRSTTVALWNLHIIWSQNISVLILLEFGGKVSESRHRPRDVTGYLTASLLMHFGHS